MLLAFVRGHVIFSFVVQCVAGVGHDQRNQWSKLVDSSFSCAGEIRWQDYSPCRGVSISFPWP